MKQPDSSRWQQSSFVDFEKIHEKDRISISGLDALTPGGALTVHLKHEDGNTDEISVGHSLNDQEIQWFYHGSALNYVGSQKQN